MLESDSKSTALSAELREHQIECDYYSRFVSKFEWEFTDLLIPPASPSHHQPQQFPGQHPSIG
jgi:hypothetical protein